MMRHIIKRLIRIYTPFIMAVASVIHASLFFFGYEGVAYGNISSTFGFSILTSIYISATSNRMCFWYKTTNYLLIVVHLVNLIYINTDLSGIVYLYAILIISILSVIAFIIYRFQRGVKKLLTE